MTDDAGYYKRMWSGWRQHGYTNHSAGQYVHPKDATIHTNTVEGYFSIFKRGTRGVYQHCGKKHLHRYLAEFDFRYSNRAANGVDDKAMQGIVGK